VVRSVKGACGRRREIEHSISRRKKTPENWLGEKARALTLKRDRAKRRLKRAREKYGPINGVSRDTSSTEEKDGEVKERREWARGQKQQILQFLLERGEKNLPNKKYP